VLLGRGLGHGVISSVMLFKMPRSKVLWVFSMGCLSFFLLLSFHVYRRGGVSYLKSKKNYYLQELRELTPPKNGVLFLGDSITAAGDWEVWFPDEVIHNRGKFGCTTENLIERIHELSEAKPDKVFVMIGVNDVLQNREVDEISLNHAEMLKSLQYQFPNAKLYVQSVLPVNTKMMNDSRTLNVSIGQLNHRLELLCEERRIHFINLFDQFVADGNELNPRYSFDGLHLSSEGYQLWKTAIQDEVLAK
jgi:lysophospholipase L1-like esterase